MTYSATASAEEANNLTPQPRVLVISHNVFSASGNMGKTMESLLGGVEPEHLAQLYFHSEVPTRRCCLRYFRVTDRDMLRSVPLRRPVGRAYGPDDIDQGRAVSRTDQGLEARVYQFSRRRTPLIYLLRDLLWRLGRWDTPALRAWIQSFQPDVIFFSAGDYTFSYRIACRISRRYGIPMLMWCCDDYYIAAKRTLSPLYHLHRRSLLQWARCAASQSPMLLTISREMQEDYAALFGVPAETVRIPVAMNPCAMPPEQRKGVVYAGNLGLHRIEPLLELGRALHRGNVPGCQHIDVYSGERNDETLRRLRSAEGIVFHGDLPGQDIPALLGRAKYLVITEAFDKATRQRTHYSLSTKIGESLASGACIVAYGPEEISSMRYLAAYQAACMLHRAEDAPSQLRWLEENPVLYQGYAQRAAALASRAHDPQTNRQTVCRLLWQVWKFGRRQT